MGEDPRLQLLQRSAGRDPDLFGEQTATLVENREGLRLTPGSIKRKHELAAKALAQRVLSHQRVKLGRQLGLPAESQIGLDPRLDRLLPKLLQPADRFGREGLVFEAGEGLSAPQAKRLAQRSRRRLRVAALELPAGLTGRGLEPVEVELLGLDQQRVALAPRHQQLGVTAVLGLEQLAQARNVRLECGGSVGRRGVAPELLDQPVGGEGLARVQEQQRQQRALLRAAEAKRLRTVGGLERPQDQKVQLRAQESESTRGFPRPRQAFVRSPTAPSASVSPMFTRPITLSAIGLATAALFGCGGGGDDASPSGAATTDTPASAEQASLPEPVSAQGADRVDLSDHLLTKLTIAEGPDWMVSAFGSLWVKQDSGGVLRVDPETGKVIARIAPDSPGDPRPQGHDCQGIGASEEAIWSCPREGTMVRIDPGTNSITATIRIDKFADQGRIVSAAGRVWVLTDGGAKLTAIDPRAAELAKTVALGGRCTDLAAAGTTVWAMCGLEDRLLRIDAETGEVSDELALAGAAAASVSDHLWVAFEGGVAQIEPETLEVLAVYDVHPRYGGAIFASSDAVWVREEGGRFLTRIDPERQRIAETINAAALPSGGDVVQIEDSVWATAYDDATLVELQASGP